MNTIGANDNVCSGDNHNDHGDNKDDHNGDGNGDAINNDH